MIEVGPHRLTCASIDSSGVDELFADGRKALIFYCDPPWGEGAMKLFATMAEKAGEKPRRIGYETLMDGLFFHIAVHVSGHVFIETGDAYLGDVLDRMAGIALSNIQTVRLCYGRKHQNVLAFGTMLPEMTAAASYSLGRLHGLSGGRVSREAIAPLAVPGEIVFDPCCGLGYSAAAAVANGMQFRGNELSAKRLAKTEARLA